MTKIIQIKHDTGRSIGSVRFEPCWKSGKLKYSSTVRVYSEDKVEIHTRYMPVWTFSIAMQFYRLAFFRF